MKRISYSHNPTISQINSISINFREKFNRCFDVSISCWTYNFDSNNEIKYEISVLPSFNNINACSVKCFSSWSELLSWYLKVMKEGLPSE